VDRFYKALLYKIVAVALGSQSIAVTLGSI